jgi:hypothetical protein
MAVETGGRSRRALLGAAVGGLGAWAAAALGRPQSASANHAGTVQLGHVNSFAPGAGFPYTDVSRSDVATGVTMGGNDYGLHANSAVDGGSALSAYNSGADTNGLRIVVIGGARAKGVEVSTNGHWSQIGVDSTADTEGIAVRAMSTNGIAVQANSPGGGYALEVNGRFVSNRSGKTTIAAGSTSKSVSGHSLIAQSLVLATIQGNVAGVWVRGVSVSPGNSFTIRLNKAAPSNLTVGWMIIN